MYFFGAKMYVSVMQYDIYLEYPGKSLGSLLMAITSHSWRSFKGVRSRAKLFESDVEAVPSG